MHVRFFLVLFLFIILPFPVWAESYTAEQLVRQALEQNEELQAQRFRIAEAQGLLKQARSLPNPTIELSATTGELTNSSGEEEFSVLYNQPLELGGRRKHRVASATYQVQAAEQALHQRENEIAAEVKKMFMEGVATQRRAELLRQSVSALENVLALTIFRINEGEASELEGGITDLELQRLNTEVLNAENDFRTRLVALRMLAVISEEDFTLNPQTNLLRSPQGSTQELTAFALQHKADLLAASLEEKGAETEIQSARAQGRWNMNAFAGYTNSKERLDQFGLNEARDVVPMKDTDNTITAGVSITLPFGNRNQGAVLAATARHSAAKSRRLALERRIRLEVWTAVEKVKNTARVLSITEEKLQSLSQKNLMIVKTAYELGELPLTQVLTEQRRAVEVQELYADALREHYTALVDLELASGQSAKPEE